MWDFEYRGLLDSKWRLVLLILFSGMLMSVNAATECIVGASPVQEDRPTSITCIFQKDIGAEKSPVNVYRYTKRSKPVLVASIMWRDKSSNNPDITVQEGYHISGTVTTRLRILVSSSSTDHAGDYRCQVLPAKSDQVPCKLEVREKKLVSTCRAQPFLPGEDADIMCQFNMDIGKWNEDILLRKISDLETRSVEESVALCVVGDNSTVCDSLVNDCEFTAVTQDPHTLKISILKAKPQHAGKYLCMRMSTVEAERETPCDLILKEPQAETQNITLIVAPVVCALVVLPLAACAIWCFYKKRCSTQQPARDETSMPMMLKER